jgi:hypothetical protein
MKTINAQLQADIEKGVVCTLMLVALANGGAMYFTDNDAPLTVDGHTYTPATGLTGMKLTITNNAQVSSQKVAAGWAFNINEADVLAGIYDNASITIGTASWENPSYGAVWTFAGDLATVQANQDGFVVDLQSSLWVLQRPLGIFISPDCRHTLGSVIDPQGVGGCGLDLTPYTYTGSITTLNSQMVFGVDIPAYGTPATPNTPGGLSAIVTQNIAGQFLAPGIYHYSVSAIVSGQESSTCASIEVTILPNIPATGGGYATLNWTAVAGATAYNVYGNTNQLLMTTVSGTTWQDNGSSGQSGYPPLFGDYFAQGIVTMTSGASTGLQSQVKTIKGTNLQLLIPFGRPVASGDTFTVTAGCTKSCGACQYKFNNVINYGGFPDLTPQRNWM